MNADTLERTKSPTDVETTSKVEQSASPCSKPVPDTSGQQTAQLQVGILAGMPFQTREQAAKKLKHSSAQQAKRPDTKSVKTDSLDRPGNETKPLQTPAAAPEGTQLESANESDAKQPEATATPTLEEKLNTLRKAAKENEPGAVAALRAFLEENPAVFNHYGDLARTARYAYAALSGNEDPLAREAVFRRSEEAIKKYLPNDNHCQTERLLAEQIVLCSLRLNYLDFETSNYATSTNSKLVGLLLRRQEQAQNQLFKAVAKRETFLRLKSKPE